MASFGACPVSVVDGIGPDVAEPYAAPSLSYYSSVEDSYVTKLPDDDTQDAAGRRTFSRLNISKRMGGGAMALNPRVGHDVFAFNFGADAQCRVQRSTLAPYNRDEWNFGPGDVLLPSEGPSNIPIVGGVVVPGFDVPSVYWDLQQVNEEIARGKGDLSSVLQFRQIPTVAGDDMVGRPKSDRVEKQDTNLARYKAVQLQLFKQMSELSKLEDAACRV